MLNNYYSFQPSALFQLEIKNGKLKFISCHTALDAVSHKYGTFTSSPCFFSPHPNPLLKERELTTQTFNSTKKILDCFVEQSSPRNDRKYFSTSKLNLCIKYKVY